MIRIILGVALIAYIIWVLLRNNNGNDNNDFMGNYYSW